MSARAWLAAGAGSAFGVALLVAACMHRKQQYRGAGQQLAGRSVVLERCRRQRRFGFSGHHDRLIVGGHVLGQWLGSRGVPVDQGQ
jgi:hypothetical protein